MTITNQPGVTIHRIEASPLNDLAEQHFVPMRDGVRIATDIYLPDGPGTHPAVLCRLPYDKNSEWMAITHIAPYYIERGYALVVQDVRGKYRSEGETFPFVNEIDDTYDSIEWLTQQSWCNGAVAMSGDSYHGYTQWAGVASGHEALRAVAPRVTGATLGAGLDITGATTGSHPGQPIGLYHANYFAHFWVDNIAYDFEVDWSMRPLRDVFDAAFTEIGTRSPVLDAMFRGAARPDPMASRSPFRARPVPVLHRVGWFDNLLDLSMRDFHTQRATPGWRDLAYLDADACDHYTYHLDEAPVPLERNHGLVLELLLEMLPRYLGTQLDFFDAFVAGTRDVATLHQATWWQGHDGSRTATSWPPPGARELRLYPTDGPSSTRSEDGGGLSVRATGAEAPAEWVHDAADPVPSTIANSFTFLVEYPDERVVQARPDVATFTTEAFERPLDLAGPVRVVASLESTAPSMDLFVKLVDVAPDGTARQIARGQHRFSGDSGGLIDLADTGYRIRPGHRLRLQFACSDFPQYLPHPGTDADPWTATAATTVPATQRLRLGAEHTFLSLVVTDPN